MMNKFLRVFVPVWVVGLFALVASTGQAWAVAGTVNITSPPPNMSSFTLVLQDEATKETIATAQDPDGDGKFAVSVPDDKKKKRACVMLRDKETGKERRLGCFWLFPREAFSVTSNFATGNTVAQGDGFGTARRGGPSGSAAMPQFSVGFFGGRSMNSPKASVDSTSLNSSGSGSVDADQFVTGVEGRFYLNPRQQQMLRLGAGLYLWGTYQHYTGGDFTNIFAEFHAPTAGLDTGMGMRMLGTLAFGLGWRTNIYQRIGLALAIGAHATRVEATTRSNETGGGGNDESFTERDTSIGPTASVELSTPVGNLSGTPIEIFARGQGMLLGDVKVSGSSTLNNDYSGKLDGGLVGNVLFGFRAFF